MTRKLWGALAALIIPAMLATSSPAEARRGRRSRAAKIAGKVNINTAKLSRLTLLPRIGKATARRIVAYRSKRHFGAIRDIMRVKGIGKRTFLLAKKHLAVRGPNTLRKLKSKRKRATRRRARRCRR